LEGAFPGKVRQNAFYENPRGRTTLAIAWSSDSINAEPCGCALAAPSLDIAEPPCVTERWQGLRGGRWPTPFTSGGVQVPGLIIKD